MLVVTLPGEGATADGYCLWSWLLSTCSGVAVEPRITSTEWVLCNVGGQSQVAKANKSNGSHNDMWIALALGAVQ